MGYVDTLQCVNNRIIVDVVKHRMCLTTSTNYTSNNLPRMKNQRVPVQF